MTIWGRREAVHRTQLSESISSWDPQHSQFLEALRARGVDEQQAYSILERMLSTQTHTLGATDFFWMTGWILLALVAVVWLARPPFGAGRTPAARTA